METSEPFLQSSSPNQGCYLCRVKIVVRSDSKTKNSIKFKSDLSKVKEYAENGQILIY